MRIALLIPLLLVAAPAVARDPSASPIGGDVGRAIADPALPGQLGRAAAAMTKALMSMPVGEVQAAIEGRAVTPADRRRTVGNSVVRPSPDLDRAIERKVAGSTAKMQRSAQAMARALPTIQRALTDAVARIDRATANLPDPTYPNR